MTFSWEMPEIENCDIDLSDFERERLEERIVRYISASIKTEQQIRLRLKKYGYDNTSIDFGIAWATKFGYINDEEYASKFYDEYTTLRHKTGTWIKQALRTKGVSSDIINDMIVRKENENNVDEINFENALLTVRKVYRNSPQDKWKQRAMNALRRDGHDYSNIKLAIAKVSEENRQEDNIDFE